MLDAVLGVVLLAGIAGGQAQAPQVAGVWRGTSECLVKDSPCHDETNVYRITAVAGKSYRYRVAGSKIVDGQEIAMGPALNWDYDPEKHILSFAVGNGHFWLRVDGDKMDGGLMLADMTVYRKIHLERVKASEEVNK